MVWLDLGTKHSGGHRKRSWFGWKYLFWSPLTQVEMSQRLVKNIRIYSCKISWCLVEKNLWFSHLQMVNHILDSGHQLSSHLSELYCGVSPPSPLPSQKKTQTNTMLTTFYSTYWAENVQGNPTGTMKILNTFHVICPEVVTISHFQPMYCMDRWNSFSILRPHWQQSKITWWLYEKS